MQKGEHQLLVLQTSHTDRKYIFNEDWQINSPQCFSDIEGRASWIRKFHFESGWEKIQDSPTFWKLNWDPISVHSWVGGGREERLTLYILVHCLGKGGCEEQMPEWSPDLKAQLWKLLVEKICYCTLGSPGPHSTHCPSNNIEMLQCEKYCKTRVGTFLGKIDFWRLKSKSFYICKMYSGLPVSRFTMTSPVRTPQNSWHCC